MAGASASGLFLWLHAQRVLFMGHSLSGRPSSTGRHGGIWFDPLNRQEFAAWLRADLPLFASEQPLRPEHLPSYLLGRVAGIYQAV
jgi:hypothetical protein